MIDLGSIKVKSSLDIESVLDFKLTAKPNEHAYIDMKVSIKSDMAMRINTVLDSLKESDISVETISLEKGESNILFSGVIRECRFSNHLGVHICILQAISKSFLMDKSQENRMLQNRNNSIHNMLNIIAQKSKAKIKFHTKDTTLNNIFFQCQETDWEFISRVASHYHQPICVDYKSEHIGLHYGIPYNHEEIYFRDDHYESGFITEIKPNDLIVGKDERKQDEFIYYDVYDYSDYDIGRKFRFLDKELYVAEKRAESSGGYVIFSYRLCSKESMLVSTKFNDNITGYTITGKVIDVKEEDVYVEFDIDVSEPSHAFAWMPVTGNIMYCMPEIGSKVQVCFGDRDESKINFACHTIDDIRTDKFAIGIKGLFNDFNSSMLISPRSVDIGNDSSFSLSEGIAEFSSAENIKISGYSSIDVDADFISFETKDELMILKK